jgi:hypothetical protein
MASLATLCSFNQWCEIYSPDDENETAKAGAYPLGFT